MSERLRPARVVMDSLRLDFDPEEAVREKAETSIALGVGGFIVFGGEREQVARLTADLRQFAGRPLWFGADLERGAGQQFAGLPTLPPPAGLAAHPDPIEAARTAGAITARGARTVGVDLVFAPALDLDVEPDNPIIGTRSFGHDPVMVAALGEAWIEGCQGEGVVACAKHFPGHGRTTADSHEEVPLVDAPRQVLEADLVPFRRVAPGVGAILTAHVAFPGLGSERPATISPEILTELLRGEMKYDGLIATDAMNMTGFLEAGENPAVAALTAGCDLLLYPDDLAATIDALEEAARDDEAVAARVADAVQRSEATRKRFLPGRFGLAPAAAQTPDADALEAAALSLLSIHRHGELPDWLRPGRPIRVIAIWDDRPMKGRTPFGARFVDEMRDAGWQVAAADPDDPPERAPAIILLASTPQAWKGTAGLTDTGRERFDRAMANPSGAFPVVFGHERQLEAAGGTGIVAWGTEPALEVFAARKLLSDAKAARGAGDGTSA